MLNAKACVLHLLLAADDETDNVTMMMMPHECDNIAWMRHGMANELKSLSEHHETSAAALSEFLCNQMRRFHSFLFSVEKKSNDHKKDVSSFLLINGLVFVSVSRFFVNQSMNT